MYKEKHITEVYPFTKADLVRHRKSDLFKVGVDYSYEQRKSGPPAIVWTKEGLKKLLSLKNIKFEEDNDLEISQEEPRSDAAPEKKSTDEKVPAIVRQLLPNRRMVACEIRGQWENVIVKDSRFLRPGTIINAVNRGGRWIGLFKVNNVGKVYAS